MLLAGLTLVVAVAVGWARGGRLRHLAAVPLRHRWLLAVAVAAQLAAPRLAPAALLASGAFLAANRRLPGLPLVAAGWAGNTAVILANGAMPVSGEALRVAAGGDPAGPAPAGRHRLLAPGDHLPLLADVIPIPVLGVVVSAGDVLLAVGVAVLVGRLMRPGDATRAAASPGSRPGRRGGGP